LSRLEINYGIADRRVTGTCRRLHSWGALMQLIIFLLAFMVLGYVLARTEPDQKDKG
jgi:hypothetical protein